MIGKPRVVPAPRLQCHGLKEFFFCVGLAFTIACILRFVWIAALDVSAAWKRGESFPDSTRRLPHFPPPAISTRILPPNPRLITRCAYPDPRIDADFPFSEAVADRVLELVARYMDVECTASWNVRVRDWNVCIHVKQVLRLRDEFIRVRRDGKLCDALPALEAEFETNVFLLGLLAKHDLHDEVPRIQFVDATDYVPRPPVVISWEEISKSFGDEIEPPI